MDVFEVDDLNKEPFLRLTGRHSNIIITPPRMSDTDDIVSILNDPRVYPTLEGPPYPYENRHAVEWLLKVKADTDRVWTCIQDATSGTNVFEASPVRIVRQVNPDGTQTYLGDCGIDRWGYPDIEDEEERRRLQAENLVKQAGDEQIVWTIGDYLAASHHGKGIMSTVLGSLMHQWAIPWMGVRQVKATAFEGNQASVRVFEKNGFSLESFKADFVQRAERKGGGTVGLQILSLNLL